MAQEYKLQDLVWAKMRGFAPWPGIIVQPPACMKNKPSKKNLEFFCIYFFGSKNYTWVDTTQLKPYCSITEEFKRGKGSTFKQACDEIEEYAKLGDKAKFPPEETNEPFDRLLNASTPAKTPRSKTPNDELSTGRAKGKALSRKLSKGETPKRERGDSDPGLEQSQKISPKKSKSPRPSTSRKSSTGRIIKKSFSYPDSEVSSDEDAKTPKRKKTSKTKWGLSVEPERKKKRSKNYDADTTTPAPWQNGGDQEYNSPAQRRGIFLLNRPTIARPDTPPPLDLEAVSETLSMKNIKPSQLKFGFLGLGIMGCGIVKNLINSGHNVTVWNRTPEKVDDFSKIGAAVAMTPSDVVQNCDVTFSCVASPQAAKDMMFGNCGALSEITEKKGYVEMSSIDSETSKEIADAVANKGGRYLEAQLQGSKNEAEEGSLLILCGGDKSLFNECHSCFEAFGKSSFYLGEVGTATKMNLIIQLQTGIMLAGMAEALSLADRAGLQLPDVLEIMCLTQINSQLIREKGKSIVDSSFTTNFALRHMQKDLRLGLELGDRLEHPLPISSNVNEVYKHAKRLGYGDYDASAVYVRARF